MPRNQAVDCQSSVRSAGTSGNLGLCVYNSPSVSTRKVSTQIVTGLTFAQVWSQVGNVSAGTNAELANTNRNTMVKLAARTAPPPLRERTRQAANTRQTYA